MRLLSALGFAVRPAPARKARPRRLAVEGLADRITPCGGGHCPLPPSQISGLVYVDQDRDGVADDTEPRLTGVTVMIVGATTDGTAVGRTAVTVEGGLYSFADLHAGTYTLAAITPAGYLPGQSSAGAFGGTTGPNITTNIQIPQGQSSGGYNFGQLTVPECPVCPPDDDDGPRPRCDNGKHKGHDKDRDNKGKHKGHDKDRDPCDRGNHGKNNDDRPKGNNGVGNGLDPQPPGNPPINDGPGTSPGSPGNRGGAHK